MRIFTSRYLNQQEIKASGCVAVGISLGKPKFPLGYEVTFLRALAPDHMLFHIHDQEAFTEMYRLQLGATGVEQIRRKLEAISQAHGGRDVVLLCFDDLSHSGSWCHRRVFADYWQEQTGEILEELPTVTDDPQPQGLQLEMEGFDA